MNVRRKTIALWLVRMITLLLDSEHRRNQIVRDVMRTKEFCPTIICGLVQECKGFCVSEKNRVNHPRNGVRGGRNKREIPAFAGMTS